MRPSRSEDRSGWAAADTGGVAKLKRRIQLRILQGLPGVGPTRAGQLLEKFGSEEAVMTASLEGLEQEEGVGAKTAAAIREVLQEAPVPYG